MAGIGVGLTVGVGVGVEVGVGVRKFMKEVDANVCCLGKQSKIHNLYLCLSSPQYVRLMQKGVCMSLSANGEWDIEEGEILLNWV